MHVNILSIQYLHGLKNSPVCHKLNFGVSVYQFAGYMELCGEHHVMQNTKVGSDSSYGHMLPCYLSKAYLHVH